MKMSRCLCATVLLMLSLEAALLVAGVDDTIRLPSDTQVAAAAKRPWKCCDTTRCTRSFPPTCSCLDELDKCPATCKSCAVSPRGRFVCNDRFRSDPGPICRPWKCCDAQPCTRSIPAICRCGDEVDKCEANCKSCVPSTANPSRFVCEDVYRGYPIAPRCRPWDCCDFPTCTKSIPPICHCRDEVDQCADTCNQCAMSTSDPSRNVCNDQFRGDPGPKCTQLEDVVTAGGNYSTTGGRV